MGTGAMCLAFDMHSEDSNITYTLWLLFLPTMPSPQLLKRPLLTLAPSGAVMEPLMTGLLCKDALQGWRELSALLLL